MYRLLLHIHEGKKGGREVWNQTRPDISGGGPGGGGGRGGGVYRGVPTSGGGGNVGQGLRRFLL
jgi:hypothetical protein